MTYTCTDIKFIIAIMWHILCISFFPSPLLWISHSGATAASYNDLQISVSSSLPLPRLAVFQLACFRYNGPKWKWKSAVLQSVSQPAKRPLKEKPQAEVFTEVKDFVFHKSPRRLFGFLCVCIYISDGRSLMSVLVKYACWGTRAWIRGSVGNALYLWQQLEVCVCVCVLMLSKCVG